jgi:histidinol-phosphate/aromatic aminotransferase/cobyric acid decarboxylase-like protein
MYHSHINTNELFFPDDFERINNKYFEKLREKGEIEADLSFWYDTIFPAQNILSIGNINKYKSDFQKGLIKEKEILLNCINNWDLQLYKYNEITICSSATTASFITLLFLQSQNITNIFFETPAYFASIEQAKSLKFNVSLIPTYLNNNFQIDDIEIETFKKNKQPKAIWLTQPRFALGINQNKERIYKLLEALTKDDFLIIDEATEQLFPVFLNDFNFILYKNIIKIRSFFKGAGLNGPRISFIQHHEKFRQKIENFLEVSQGAIDCFSLEFAKKQLNNIDFFKSILNTSNEYVKHLSKKIQLQTHRTRIIAIPLVNGYIGSIAVKLRKEKNYLKEREELLKYCAKSKVTIIVGATMKFAKDISYEYIRINYFNNEYTVLKGIELVIKFNNK